jgi:hypothetical protein
MKHVFVFALLFIACNSNDTASKPTDKNNLPNTIIDSAGIRPNSNQQLIPINQTGANNLPKQIIPQQQPTQQVTQNAATTAPITYTNNKGQTITQAEYDKLMAQTQKTVTASSAKGLNPAHGQPGHRCDIAVGQPLNSKPTVAPSANTKISNPITTVTPTTAPTAPGMNPPHGQPNHRCDIGVGQPLNSKPITTTVADTTKQ